MVRASLRTCGPRFGAGRMIEDYAAQIYPRALMRGRQARGLTLDRRTQAMGAVAVAGVLGAGAVELARVWRRGSAPLPAETDDLFEAAGTATLETIAVVREGYRATSDRENAVFNLLVSFTATFGITRASTALIRSGKGYGVFRNLTIADRRVHHFVPGHRC